MLDKKIKILVGAILTTVLSFNISPSYANNLSIHGEKILLAEALVEYPYGWFFTLDEIEEIYEVEYYDNNRLGGYIKHENGKLLNQCYNEPFEIPEKFIETTLNMLKQMLDKGLTRYLFRLDTFHGHLFVSDSQFERKYLNLNIIKMMKEEVHDNSLGILFHCAEHMALRNPPHTGSIDKKAQELRKLRNIIGRYDEGSIEVVNPPKKELVGSGKSNTAVIPQGFRQVGFITFRANINGEFSIKHAGQTIRLDLSLCDHYYH